MSRKLGLKSTRNNMKNSLIKLLYTLISKLDSKIAYPLIDNCTKCGVLQMVFHMQEGECRHCYMEEKYTKTVFDWREWRAKYPVK